MGLPLGARRPLWEFRLFQPYQDRGCALVGGIHHAIGDGVALMLVLLSLTDLRASGPATVLPRPDEGEPGEENDASDGRREIDPRAARGSTPSGLGANESGAAEPDEGERDGERGGNPFTALFCDPACDLVRIRAPADEVMPDLMNLLTRPVEVFKVRLASWPIYEARSAPAAPQPPAPERDVMPAISWRRPDQAAESEASFPGVSADGRPLLP